MKVEIDTPKRGKKCFHCSGNIGAGIQYFLTTEWIPGMQYPLKRNVCFECAGKQIKMIDALQELLNNLKKIKYQLDKVV